MVTGVDDEIKKEIRGKNGLDSLIPPYQKRREAAIGKHVFTPLYHPLLSSGRELSNRLKDVQSQPLRYCFSRSNNVERTPSVPFEKRMQGRKGEGKEMQICRVRRSFPRK